MRVLVTGGCGFVGSAVVRMAVERGDHVLNLDRRKKSVAIPALTPIAQRDGYARLEADITDRTLVRAVLREFSPDAVIHLAAISDDDPNTLIDGEVGGAFAVLEAARQYYEKLKGDTRDRFRILHVERAESDVPDRMSRAHAARVSAAVLMDRWARANDLPLVTCVAGEAFGPWQPNTSFMATMIASLLYSQPVQLPDAGENMRDWLPIRDLAAGVLLAAEAAPPQSRYDFSVGAERRDIDVAESVCALMDDRSPLPGGRAWSSLLIPAGDRSTAQHGPMLDSHEAERELGWKPQGFHAGLDRLLSWSLASFAASRARHTAVAAE